MRKQCWPTSLLLKTLWGPRHDIFRRWVTVGRQDERRTQTEIPNSIPSQKLYDVAIIGGGIVGISAARELLLRRPQLSLIVLEKEADLAMHQSSHNSGVIHAGIYYKPGSARARLCTTGAHKLYSYCEKKRIPYVRCGKLIVALDERELPYLDELYRRGLENKVPDLRIISKSEISQFEPYIQGIKAIHSPNTGIVDFQQVAKSFAEDVLNMGGLLLTSFSVSHFLSSERGSTIIAGDGRQVLAKNLITCAGLHADRIAQKIGGAKEPAIVPFRGDFLKLKKEYSHMVKGNIYPVPNPQFPFLGVHFTPKMNGEIWLGPNAVLAFAREGYNLRTVNLRDLMESIAHPGLQKLTRMHFKFGMRELYRDIFPAAYVKALQRYMPSLTVDQTENGGSGVRAQAIGTDGKLIEDFVFEPVALHGRVQVLHVRNAPSPAATSSLSIAEEIISMAEASFWP